MTDRHHGITQYDAIVGIYDFLRLGLYDFAVETWSWVIIKITYFRYTMMLAAIDFSWDIAKSILIQLNITTELNNALSRLPSETVSHLNFFNIIAGFNLLINAFVTRFVMSFRIFG